MKLHLSCFCVSLLTKVILAEMPTLLNLYLKIMIIWDGFLGEYKSLFDELSAHLFIKTYLRRILSHVLIRCPEEAKGTFLPLTVTALPQFYEIVFRSSYMPRGFVLFLFVLCDPQIKWKLSTFMTFFSCLAHGGWGHATNIFLSFTQLPSTPVKRRAAGEYWWPVPMKTTVSCSPTGDQALCSPYRKYEETA